MVDNKLMDATAAHAPLTRRQREVYRWLRNHAAEFPQPPTLDQLCAGLGVASRGSLHKHIRALEQAGLVEPMNGRQRGVRLTPAADSEDGCLPLLGRIAAGRPLEALENPEPIPVPPQLRGRGRCYVLEVRGESMREAGILDGDLAVIEQRAEARDGEIVVALVDGSEATLKRIERRPGEVVLHPANRTMEPLHYAPNQVQVQGVLVGLMRGY